MSRKPRRCRASRGNLKEASETPGAQGKLGRQWEGQEAGKAQAFGSILDGLKQHQKTQKHEKTINKHEKNMKNMNEHENMKKPKWPSGIQAK